MFWAPIEYAFMKLVIVFYAVSVILLISAFICVNRFDKQFFKSDEDFPEERQPFSVPDYLDRMEKMHLKALQERENTEPHIIVLWWGFDGLRLNADGTSEWISRRPKEDYVRTVYKPWMGEDMHVQTSDGCGYIYHDGQYFLTEIPERIVFNSANYLQPTTLNDCSVTHQINYSIAKQTADLDAQIQALNFQLWQNQMTQNMNVIGQNGRARNINGEYVR